MTDDPYELLLNSTWRPTLSVTGVDGIPSLQNAGNVLRPIHRAQAVVPPAAGRRSASAPRRRSSRRWKAIRRTART